MASSQKRKRKTKSKGERREAANQSARSKLLEEMKRSGQRDNTLIIFDPPGAEKMSEVLVEYAEPLTESILNDDEQGFRNALSVAMLCWNAALATEEQREEMFLKFLGIAKAEAENAPEQKETLQMFRFMIRRKNELYPKIQRFIVRFEVKATKKSREVVVVSTMERKDIKRLLPKVKKPWWQRILFWM